MRQIDADDLQKSLNDYVFNDPTCPLHIAATVDQYIDFAPTVGGWISCSERMPEPGVNVLVTDGINQMVTWHEVIDGKAMWVDNFIVYVNVRFGEVTHWMPLPEPPGGDDNA